MENSPLSDRPTSKDDAAVFPDSGSCREQSSHDREMPARAATHTRGARTRVRSWMRAGALDWGIRIAVVGLVIGGFFAIYINGVNEGWWHAWGEAPTVTTTGPTVQPTPAPSSEPAMSGGYQIGPDGVLVRPAEYAAENYPKPELPEAAKENTERGAEAAAEHYLALLVYAWNTGDTQPFADMSASDSKFAHEITQKISDLYGNGWAYDNSSVVERVLKLEPAEAADEESASNAVSVVFAINSSDGTICQRKNIYLRDQKYHSIFALVMTWENDRWVVTQAGMEKTNA